MSYSQIVKEVLDWQLARHEKFLHSFVQKFKEFDENCDGVLNQDETVRLLQSMKLGLEEM